MKSFLLLSVGFVLLVQCKKPKEPPISDPTIPNSAVIINLCVSENSITPDWREVLHSRQSSNYLDSLDGIQRPLTEGEEGWYKLIQSRIEYWTTIRDSLKVPFGDLDINDTTLVYLGYLGSDDGFTFGYNTVCFDLTALQIAYGSAQDSVNTDRMDRIFAHEYTHLLSKEWARQTGLVLTSFRDSILWECIYEGIGMYRSMSSKWFPQNGHLSSYSKQVFSSLYPVFAERLTTIDTSTYLSADDRKRLHRNLSRGSMHQKWGALPVGVWLALEADGNDQNLVKWVNDGPDAVIPLGRKYLTGEALDRFEGVFGQE